MKNRYKPLIFLILLVIGVGWADAQSLDRQVVSCAGGQYFADNLHFSWTLGQIENVTATNGGYMLSQGFQQPHRLILTARPEVQALAARLRLYPNPTRSELTLSFEFTQPGTLTLTITDITGKIVLPNQTHELKQNFGSIPLDVQPLAAGMYFLQASYQSGAQNQTVVSKFIIY